MVHQILRVELARRERHLALTLSLMELDAQDHSAKAARIQSREPQVPPNDVYRPTLRGLPLGRVFERGPQMLLGWRSGPSSR